MYETVNREIVVDNLGNTIIFPQNTTMHQGKIYKQK